jgi:hypothetical protein
MKIWTYNLTSFDVKEEEVDEIRDGKAIRKRGSNSKELNNKTFMKFEASEEDALIRVKAHLNGEIYMRENRMQLLRDALSEVKERLYNIQSNVEQRTRSQKNHC